VVIASLSPVTRSHDPQLIAAAAQCAMHYWLMACREGGVSPLQLLARPQTLPNTQTKRLALSSTVLTIRTTCFNIKNICVLFTQRMFSVHVYRVSLTINSIKPSVFVTGTHCVFCETGIEFVNIIYRRFRLQNISQPSNK
jgi:hypothetical protein